MCSHIPAAVAAKKIMVPLRQQFLHIDRLHLQLVSQRATDPK